MLAWLRSLHRGHPSFERLVELASGGAPEPALEGHLDGCRRCRRRLASLRGEWRRVAAMETTAGVGQEPDYDALLERIFAAVRSCAGLRKFPPAWLTARRNQLSQRLTALMSDCFGTYGLTAAAESLKENPDPDPARTLARCGDLLSTFLGRKVAGQLADQVLAQLNWREG